MLKMPLERAAFLRFEGFKLQFIVLITFLENATAVPCRGPYFLVAEQESKQRTQLRGGFELFAPANKATSPKYPSRHAFTVDSARFRCGISKIRNILRSTPSAGGGS